MNGSAMAAEMDGDGVAGSIAAVVIIVAGDEVVQQNGPPPAVTFRQRFPDPPHPHLLAAARLGPGEIKIGQMVDEVMLTAGGAGCYRQMGCLFILESRRDIVIASAAAVASSSSDALAISISVRSMIICWKIIKASRRPWLISGWYGV